MPSGVKRKRESSSSEPPPLEPAQPRSDTGTSFELAWFDECATDDRLQWLTDLKWIVSARLPNMPREYITRMICDRTHRALCILKRGDDGRRRVIGGIVFRAFHRQHLIEIVFLAIKKSEQVKGYGRRIMNALKEHAKTEGFRYMLTYADKHAVGYFRKQGFSKIITMLKRDWSGYIKDYEGAFLMECKVDPNVCYVDIPNMIQQQRLVVYNKIREVSGSHEIKPGLACFKRGKKKFIRIRDIAGVVQAGWKPPPKPVPLQQPGAQKQLWAKLHAILRGMKEIKESWPFHKPVDASEVDGYYSIITNPMDFMTMTQKLKDGKYRERREFNQDCMLVFDNCRAFNGIKSEYYDRANKTERRFHELTAIHFPNAKLDYSPALAEEMKNSTG